MTDEIEPIKFRGNPDQKPLPPDEREQAILDWLESMEKAGFRMVAIDPDLPSDKEWPLMSAIREEIWQSRDRGEESLSDEMLAARLAVGEVVNRFEEPYTREHINRTRNKMRALGMDV